MTSATEHDAGGSLAAHPDPRKTAAIADARRGRIPGAVQIRDAQSARAVLRSKVVKQAGFGAEMIPAVATLANPPVALLDGEPHRRQRAATARFFAPVVVTTRYTELMEHTADRLIARFRRDRRASLEDLSMELSVTIAAEIVGLTDSDRAGMSRRLNALLGDGNKARTDFVSVVRQKLRSTVATLQFLLRDVRPAMRSRRTARREDVISHMVQENYATKEVMAECITYGVAGMITTREFIVMAFWHLMERDDLRARFLGLPREEQLPLLEEILRTEPIVGVLTRRATADIEIPPARPGEPPVRMPSGTLFEIDIRAANSDPAAVGECPFAVDPDRPVAQKPGGAMFAFGDGVHRCPGGQVAIQETAVFLDRLLRVPGLRLSRQPKIGWKPLIEGYEISEAIITCD